PNVIKAQLEHLRNHNETAYLNEALVCLKNHRISIDFEKAKTDSNGFGGCKGSKIMNFKPESDSTENGERKSHLSHWPIQLHLISPLAAHYKNSDLLVCADCVAFTTGDFHKNYLKGKTLVIACPKLDNEQEIYLEKLTSLINDAFVNTITVMIMEVPCCKGLLNLVQKASENANRKVPVRCIICGIQGEKICDKWI
ncbi:MAG: hypothetical protein Q4F84_07795, partial [Fibrobacter sp.]|nr:hypothetical protein [Fibrobacter sp.]